MTIALLCGSMSISETESKLNGTRPRRESHRRELSFIGRGELNAFGFRAG